MDKKILRTLAVLTLGVGLNTLTADNADAGMTYKELPTQVRMAFPRADAGLQLGDDARAVVREVRDAFMKINVGEGDCKSARGCPAGEYWECTKCATDIIH